MNSKGRRGERYELRAGKRSNLKVTEFVLPQPTSGQAQIEVKTIGLNFADIFAIWGLYSATPKGKFTPGLEFAGKVTEVGPEVDQFKPGDRVMGVTRFGGYTTLLNHDVRYLVKLPDHWSFEEGASFLVQVLTAYYAIVYLGQARKGETILIHSGAGGVGLLALRIAKSLGLYTIGTTSRTDKLDFMVQSGYDAAITRDKDFSSRLEHALDGRALDLILECIGGQVLSEGFRMLAPMGRMVVYGSAQFASPGNRPNYFNLLWKYLFRPRIDPLQLPEKNKAILGFNLIWLYEHVELMHEILQALPMESIGKPYVGQTFTWPHLPEAVGLLQSGKSRGKVVVVTGTEH